MPNVQDQFKLIYGDDREATGTLLALNGKDATVIITGENDSFQRTIFAKCAKTNAVF